MWGGFSLLKSFWLVRQSCDLWAGRLVQTEQPSYFDRMRLLKVDPK